MYTDIILHTNHSGIWLLVTGSRALLILQSWKGFPFLSGGRSMEKLRPDSVMSLHQGVA